MLDLSIYSNVDDVIRQISSLAERHVPFALSKALNTTAFKGRDKVKGQMSERFTLRNNWTQKGVKVQTVDKADVKRAISAAGRGGTGAQAMSAAIYTMDWYMRQQEEGGTRTPKSNHLWIAARNRGGLYPARKGGAFEGMVLKKQGPKAVGADLDLPYPSGRRSAKNKKPYATPKAFKKKNGVYIRKKRGPDRDVIKLYNLVDQANIKKRWHFEETLRAVAAAGLRNEFIKAMSAALATSRTPIGGGDLRILEWLTRQG